MEITRKISELTIEERVYKLRSARDTFVEALSRGEVDDSTNYISLIMRTDKAIVELQTL